VDTESIEEYQPHLAGVLMFESKFVGKDATEETISYMTSPEVAAEHLLLDPNGLDASLAKSEPIRRTIPCARCNFRPPFFVGRCSFLRTTRTMRK